MIRAESLADLESRYLVHKLWEANNPDALIDEVAPRIRAVVTEGWAPADFQAKFPNLELIASMYKKTVENLNSIESQKKAVIEVCEEKNL